MKQRPGQPKFTTTLNTPVTNASSNLGGSKARVKKQLQPDSTSSIPQFRLDEQNHQPKLPKTFQKDHSERINNRASTYSAAGPVPVVKTKSPDNDEFVPHENNFADLA